jgi:hypothetical protein
VAILPLDQPLLSKAVRGQQEHMVYMEIQRLLKNEFQPQHEPLKEAHQAFVLQDSEIFVGIGTCHSSAVIERDFV